MHRFFTSEFFNFEFIRILGAVSSSGAETAECLEAASEIKDANSGSWCQGCLRHAQRAETNAAQALQDGDRIAARDALIRCSNYYPAAQYMINSRGEAPDPRVLELSEKSVTQFYRASKFFDGEVVSLSIPYQDELCLPGYLYLPPPHRRLPGRVPVLIICGGADSTQEELYSLFSAAGVERGYAVVTFDGPGQGIFLRRHGISMRPDWEVVIDHVLNHIDTLLDRFYLDDSRIGIAGASMGAYFALRSASDKRVAACVAIDPIYDMWDLATDRMPEKPVNAWVSGWLSDRFIDSLWRVLCVLNFQLRWELQHCMSIFGLATPSAALRHMRLWTLRGESDKSPFLTRVRCPVLVSGASRTIYTRPDISTVRVVEDLAHLSEAEKDVWIADEPGDGGLQGKVGAWRLAQQRTFAFLDRHLQVQRQPLLKAS
ncbi:alpha/beta hydrolase [Poronia punctata]|nr:alpha/beta hydrolase [Poronia punctata]